MEGEKTVRMGVENSIPIPGKAVQMGGLDLFWKIIYLSLICVIEDPLRLVEN